MTARFLSYVFLRNIAELFHFVFSENVGLTGLHRQDPNKSYLFCDLFLAVVIC